MCDLYIVMFPSTPNWKKSGQIVDTRSKHCLTTQTCVQFCVLMKPNSSLQPEHRNTYYGVSALGALQRERLVPGIAAARVVGRLSSIHAMLTLQRPIRFRKQRWGEHTWERDKGRRTVRMLLTKFERRVKNQPVMILFTCDGNEE